MNKEEWTEFRRQVKQAYGWHSQMNNGLEHYPCGYQDAKGEEYDDALHKSLHESFETCFSSANKIEAIRLFTSEDRLAKKAERMGGLSPKYRRLYYHAHNYKYEWVETWVVEKIKAAIQLVDFPRGSEGVFVDTLIKAYGAGDWVRHEVEEFILNM